MTRMDVARASAALALALVLGCAGAAPARADDPILHLRAWAVNLNNGARTNTVDIVIERWSTPQEIEKLRGVLLEDRTKLLDAVQKVKPRCGYFRASNTLGWDIQFAHETQMDDGARKIVIGTDRPVSFYEARNNPRSRDYEFTLAEIRMPKDPKGKGQGKAIPAAKVTWDKEKNTLEIENYSREPVRLNEISVVK
jgi:hypothetical protein